MLQYVKIDDFIEDLNYKGIALHIDKDAVRKEDLKKALERDEVNKIYRFDRAWDTGLFTIENCDLDDLTMEDCLDGENRSIFTIVESTKGEFYIQVPSSIEWWVKEDRLVELHDSKILYLYDLLDCFGVNPQKGESMSVIHDKILEAKKRIFWRDYYCDECESYLSSSNWSPCNFCHGGDLAYQNFNNEDDWWNEYKKRILAS